MATLNGTQINNTYVGLIKTTDNAILGAVEKEITDGDGNASTLKLGTTSASFVGTLDLTGATVTGLPVDGVQSVVAGTNVTVDNTDPANPIVSAVAGLVAGTGLDSMKSAATLTTTPAIASGTSTIALGQNANATSGGSDGTIAIGKNTSANGNKALAVGFGNSLAGEGIAIGDNVDIASGSDRAIGIGNGINLAAGVADSVTIGTGTSVTADSAIAIGRSAVASASQAVAIGRDVTADKANTVSMKALDLQTASTPTAGGIIMTDAGSTERRLNIDASGALQIDSTPVGGGAAGLVSGIGTDSMKSADTLTTLPADAPTTGSIALGDNAIVEANATRPIWSGLGHIAIGKSAFVNENSFGDFYTHACIAIGPGAIADSYYDGGSVAIGSVAKANAMHAISIGATTNSGEFAIAMGQNTTAGNQGVSIGRNANAAADSVSIGKEAKTNATTESVAIGIGAVSAGNRSVSIGRNASANGNSVAVGNFSGGPGVTSISMACSSLDVQTARASSAVLIVPGPIGGQNNAGASDSIVIGSNSTSFVLSLIHI